MLTIRSSVEPDVRTIIDRQERSLTVEFMLPGVRTETISLKVDACSVFMRASASNTSYAKYIVLHHPILHQQASAVFRSDTLRVILPLRG
jgi:HSP20 family molecular chaperone IbpA